MFDVAIAAASVVGAIGLCAAGWLFARSLLPGATPLVFRFAAATDPTVAARPRARTYLRGLTALWSLALLAAAWLALRRAAGLAGLSELPDQYTFALPLAAILVLFFGERTVRRAVFGADTVSTVREQWQVALRIMKDEFRGRGRGVESQRAVAAHDLDRTAIMWRDRACTMRELLAAAQALAPRLPPGQRVLVACDDRAVFLWTVLAIWAARRTAVMPPPDLKLCTQAAHERVYDCLVTDRADACAADVPHLRVTADGLRDALADAPALPAAFALPDAHPAALFFTSGSTGQPALQARSWAQLADGADAMTELLRLRDAHAVLAGTVVHSHMFGFEMLVMQVLRGTSALYAHRVVYPSDLAAFCASQRHGWLVSTPYHLQILADSGPLPRGLQRVVSATTPLAAELAARVEQDTGAEVHEIYGSTEAGCIATRRTVAGPAWTLAPDLALQADGDGAATLTGPRVGGTLRLRDRIVAAGDGFELLGRDSDVVKVAGKRTSLQALSAILCDIDGVRDGVFIDGSLIGQTRLAAIAVAPGLSADRIRDALAARIDSAFLPRPLVLLAELPRDANGKLRRDALLDAIAAARRRPAATIEPEVL